MKKVLIITYYWPPSGGAGVQRWLKFTKYLPEYGWIPYVLTVDENFASYPQTDISLNSEIDPNLKVFRTKSFEPLQLYKKFGSSKEVPFGGFSNSGKINIKEKIARTIRGNLFIPDARIGWNRYAYNKAAEIIENENIGVVITTGPPHSTHLIGKKLRNKYPVKWLADFRDPWTDIYYYKSLYHTCLARWIDKRMERSVIQNCDEFITVSNDVKLILSSKTKDLTKKGITITNGYDDEDFQDPQINRCETFTITYTGTIARSYHIDNFILAIQQLPSSIRDQIVIRFVGNVPNEIVLMFIEAGLKDHLEIIKYVPHPKAIQYMFETTVLMMAIPDTPNNAGIITGKLFEYLASRRPILALGPKNGEVDRILEETKSGKLFEYDQTDEIKEYIILLFNKFTLNTLAPNSGDIIKYSRNSLTGDISTVLNNLFSNNTLY